MTADVLLDTPIFVYAAVTRRVELPRAPVWGTG